MSGVIGIYSQTNQQVCDDLYYGLYALQHRGQLSCGIAVNDNGFIDYHKGLGIIPDVFTSADLKVLRGNIALGHVHYSNTVDSQSKMNISPVVVGYKRGTLAIAGDGSIVNYKRLRAELEDQGMVFQSELDTEVLAILMAKYHKLDLDDAFVETLKRLVGAYAIVMMTPDCIVAARDPHGIKPLTLGRLGDDYIVASESCAIETLGGTFVRDIAPGEVIRIDKNGLTSKILRQEKRALCMFELVYLARPDSIIDSKSVYLARVEVGKQLYRENPIKDVDIVIGAPDSGIAAAIGYAQESGIPYAEGLVKNRYIGRTFIEPTQSNREHGVKIKLNPLRENVKGKRIVLVDDSIVRGTTIKHTIEMLKQAGAQSVHIRIASPPVKYSCHLGVDMHTEEQLISHQKSTEEIREMIGADSLYFITVEGISKATDKSNGFCKGCFTRNYPVERDDYETNL